MCGIFAYMGHKPLPILEVLKVLHILESQQEPDEKTPLGGDGAGIAHLNKRNEFTLTKVGKTRGSPVDGLSQQLKDTALSSRLVLGHVRQASKEFEETIPHRECAQPYKPTCTRNLNIVSAHNGFLQDYQELKNKLTAPHSFESQKIKLIDSEIPPHLYEELLNQTKDPTKATHTLFEKVKGTQKHGNTVVILHKNKKEAYLNIIQKGKTRGLIVWTNPEHEVLVCSREKPIKKILTQFLKENNFQKTIKVTHNDLANITAHFNLKLPLTST